MFLSFIVKYADISVTPNLEVKSHDFNQSEGKRILARSRDQIQRDNLKLNCSNCNSCALCFDCVSRDILQFRMDLDIRFAKVSHNLIHILYLG